MDTYHSMAFLGFGRPLAADEKDQAIQGLQVLGPQLFLRAFGTKRCIPCVRATMAVLNEIGINSQAVPVKLSVLLPQHGRRMDLGSSPEELIARRVNLLPQEHEETGWLGHLVVITDDLIKGYRCLLDPSFEQIVSQFKAAGVSVEWQTRIEIFPLAPRSTLKTPQTFSSSLDCGSEMLLTYTPFYDNSYRSNPSWKYEVVKPIADAICEVIAEKLALPMKTSA